MFYNKLQNRKKIKKLKKRSAPPGYTKKAFKKGHVLVHYKTGGLLELSIYKRIIRGFRRKVRRKKYTIIFLFLPNYAHTRKSAKSRMGKGKGKFRRFLVKLKAMQPIMSVRDLAIKRLFFFLENFGG